MKRRNELFGGDQCKENKGVREYVVSKMQRSD